MAEVFGVATSAIGIAGFAVQIAETALKLKHLWCFIKDAPEDIQAMIEEVELSFNEVLSEIQTQTTMQRIPTMDTKISESCIERCARASRNLTSALTTLESGMKKSPR